MEDPLITTEDIVIAPSVRRPLPRTEPYYWILSRGFAQSQSRRIGDLGTLENASFR